MKKSVIITIAAVYIFAIIAVGLLGIKLKVYDEVTYVEGIACVSKGYVDFDPNDPEDKNLIDEGFSGYIMNRYTEGLSIEVRCKVFPDSLGLENLEYQIESKVATGERLDDGTFKVHFTAKGVADIHISANDGSNVKLIIKVFAI